MAQRSPVVPVTSEDLERATAADQAGVSPQVLGEPTVDTEDPIQKTKEAIESGLVEAKDALGSAQRKVSDSVEAATQRFREFARQRPLHLLGMVAGVAFTIGIGLRIWRSSRYE